MAENAHTRRLEDVHDAQGGEVDSRGPRSVIDIGQMLHDVAEATAPRWGHLAQAQGRTIRLEVAVRRGLQVTGWPRRLRAAFTNLILNAVDALPEGGEIRLQGVPAGDRVIVEVSDNGVGMSPEVRARCFEPFFTTKGEGGSGLGLPEVRSVITQHGGSVDVESHLGRGTSFRIVLPAAPRSPA
jgi:signal transduction histidine kinase